MTWDLFSIYERILALYKMYYQAITCRVIAKENPVYSYYYVIQNTSMEKKVKKVKKVTIFGKPGGGKTTLAKKLSFQYGIDHYPLDLIEYRKNSDRVTREKFMSAHKDLMSKESWVIDGLGVLQAFWERIESADTIIYIDLPYKVHYWWVIKRYLKSVFVRPEGWPEGSSIFKGTIASWKYLGLSRHFWTPELLVTIKERAAEKNFVHITNTKQFNNFN